jgi:hypothetical protein
MQLKKIVDSIIQSHKNEVARDVKILIDRHFAIMSKDILSAISQQSDIPKADSAKKNVDTCMYGSNVGATVDRQDPCETAELEFLSVGLQHKYPLQQEANLVRPQTEDFLLELQQNDSMDTLHNESPFFSSHLEDLSVGMQQEDHLVSPPDEALLVSKDQQYEEASFVSKQQEDISVGVQQEDTLLSPLEETSFVSKLEDSLVRIDNEAPLVSKDHQYEEAIFVSKQQEDISVGVQQEDTLLPPHEEASFLSKLEDSLVRLDDEGPLATKQQEDNLMTPSKDAHLSTKVQLDNLVTSPKEAHFNSKQQEICQLNIGVAQQLEGRSNVRL